MAKWDVTLEYETSFTFGEIEADNEEEARSIALEMDTDSASYSTPEGVGFLGSNVVKVGD